MSRWVLVLAFFLFVVSMEQAGRIPRLDLPEWVNHSVHGSTSSADGEQASIPSP